MLSAIINSWGAFVRQRPVLIELIVAAIVSWTPAAMVDCSALSIRSVEKSMRILMTHIIR